MNKFSFPWRSREQSRITLKRRARFQAALCYPHSYIVGMSNLGVHTVYRLLNERVDVRCERVFGDTSKRGRYYSVESRTPLAAFDIIALSLSYELDCAQAISFIRSVRSAQGTRSLMPLVIMGGMMSVINIRPLAPWVDVIVMGEAEETLHALMDLLSAHGPFHSRAGKDRFLNEAAHIPALFVPGISRVTGAPGMARDINAGNCSSQIVTPHTEFSNTFLIELSRGCPWQCRFCVTGARCGPFRPRRLNVIVSDLEEGLRMTDKVGLVAAAVSDYPELPALLDWLALRRARVSVSSLRAESTPEVLLRALAQSGQQSVTFAPETGSERLRQLLHKKLKDGELLEQCRRAQAAGLTSVKLYFMIGLPEETMEDLSAIKDLADRCRAILPVKLNIGIFVPKPHTALAAHPFAGVPAMEKKLQYLRRLLDKSGIPVRYASPREAEREYTLAHGDEDVVASLRKA